MKKYISIASAFLSLFIASVVYAQNNKESWVDAVVREKAELRAQLELADLPVMSEWMKPKMKAASMTVNVKGLNQLILLTDGGPDGPDWDHAVWGNARFVKADGSFVWLDQLKPSYDLAGWGGQARRNENIYGRPLVVAGTRYEHGILCHANGMLIFPVEKDYVRFEAEVGIDDESPYGTTYFIALNVLPKENLERLKNAYPKEYGRLAAGLDNPETWLVSKGDVVEKSLVEKASNQLSNKTYFQAAIQKIEKEKDVNTRIRQYLELFEQAQDVIALQQDLVWLNMEAVALAYADMKQVKGFDSAKYDPMYKELKALSEKGFSGIYSGNKQSIVDAQRALELKRTILLGNPLLDMDKVLVSRFKLGGKARTAMAPDLGTQSNNWSNQQSANREGFDAEIVEMSNLRGSIDEIKMRRIFKPEGSASIADLKLHWDGNRVLFTSLMPDKRWNIFETTLDGNGTAKPMVDTVEPDLEFFDGAYLPDGRMIAISNVGYQGVPCVNGWDPVGNSMLYDPKTKHLRRLTFDQDANWNPVIMHNGRVMYTRWEYTDLTHYFSRIVMHMNPDGTENKALFGSGSMFPNSTFDMQLLPGHSSAFVGIISGHHGIARSGRIILFDPAKARTGVAGMIQEIPYRNRPIEPIVKDELVNDVWPQFIKPYPLDDKYYLVAAKLTPNSLWGIYLVDVFDNVTLLAAVEGEGLISPIPVRQTKVPPAIPDRVKLGDKEATVFIQDLYEGEGLRGVPRGTVKALRVLSYEYAYVMSPSDFYAQGIQSGWDIKRLLGVVPVEADGSVMFKVPANMPIALQPLDSEGRAIQWMRSWFTAMPGEIVSCVGCHEDQNKIPIPKRVIASRKAPVKMTLPEGGVRSYTFDYEVQPILDRACVACHNGEIAPLDFRGGKKDKDTGFGTSYLAIHPFINRQGSEADIIVLAPYEYHASTSELVRLLKNGHHNVELTDKEWQTLYNWIDFNAPDKGMFNNISKYRDFDQYERRQELGKKYADGVSVDWKAELRDYANYLKGKGEIVPVMPEPEEEIEEFDVVVNGWPFDAAAAQKKQAQEKELKKEVTIAPGVKMTFVRIPAGEFVMGSYRGDSTNHPPFKAAVNKSFWMAEVEVTNEQYNVIFPDHDSRYVDQFWKDHTTPGYPANLPYQPVIRISWEEAMNYCKQLSEQTGLNMTLPTEAQWEWACRAGSDQAFWFGDLNSDFSKKENLADAQLSKMAVSGIDPQPMPKNDFWYKYFNFVPKAESVDDGNMLQVDSKSYEKNPFGLYSMHGNIAEWTRSAYQPYPYDVTAADEDAKAEYRVVRGGSYWDRPKFATAYTRKYFYPWQKVKNVGFRVIIED